MSVESALYSKLAGTAAINAIIGSGASVRLYPAVAPASTERPYITYQVISTRRSRHFAGVSGTQVDFARVQIDVWAASSLSRRTLAQAVRAALDGFSGSMGSELLNVRRVAVSGPDMTENPPEYDDETPTYRARLDAEISHW